MLTKAQVNEQKEYAVPDVFFIIMTIKHQLVFASEVEETISKSSHISAVLLVKTNNLISQLLTQQTIHQSDVHNYLINFRTELPKLSIVFGGSGLLPVEF